MEETIKSDVQGTAPWKLGGGGCLFKGIKAKERNKQSDAFVPGNPKSSRIKDTNEGGMSSDRKIYAGRSKDKTWKSQL